MKLWFRFHGLVYFAATGHYLFTKIPYRTSDESRLEGVKAVAQANGACVTFWYHMYGDAIGTLKVYTERGGSLGSARWSKTGYTKVSQWYEASISIDPKSEFKVRHAELTVGDEYPVSSSKSICICLEMAKM